MIHFYAHDLLQVATELTTAFTVIDRRREEENKSLDSGIVVEMQQRLNRLSAALSTLPVDLSRIAIARIERRMGDGITYGDLKFLIAELHNRVREELSLYHVYALTPDKLRYAEPKEPVFGADVEGAFPGASYDIEEAAKCLAFRRSTACVFHLMRVLELGLAAMARKFKVPHEREQWNNMIEGIESKIKDMNANSHGSNWRDQRDFYSGAAAHFRLLKDSWRNHTMHAREKYTEEQADATFNSTKGFMNHLSQRVSG